MYTVIKKQTICYYIKALFSLIHKLLAMIRLCNSVSIILIFISRVLLINGFLRYSSINHVPTLRLLLINDIINRNQLDEITSNASNPVVIDFQKSQCKPCIRIAPLFKDLSEKYISNVSFYKVDADSSAEALALLKELNIRSVPTFHIYNHGRKIDEVRGAHIDELEDLIKDEIKKNNDLIKE